MMRRVAHGLIVVLLFAQAAVAANACLAAISARGDAVAIASHEGCDIPQENLGLCLYQCADQYNPSPSQSPEFPPAVFAFVAPPLVLTDAPPAGAWLRTSPTTGPPIPIRHCSLRI
jgi:hypothetical protein